MTHILLLRILFLTYAVSNIDRIAMKSFVINFYYLPAIQNPSQVLNKIDWKKIPLYQTSGILNLRFKSRQRGSETKLCCMLTHLYFDI